MLHADIRKLPQQADRGAGEGAVRAAAADAGDGQVSAPALRRHAPARVAHPHAGARSVAASDGRAVRRARCADAAAGSHRSGGAVAAAPADGAVHHAQRRGGRRPVRSDPRDEPEPRRGRRRDPRRACRGRVRSCSATSRSSPRTSTASTGTSSAWACCTASTRRRRAEPSSRAADDIDEHSAAPNRRERRRVAVDGRDRRDRASTTARSTSSTRDDAARAQSRARRSRGARRHPLRDRSWRRRARVLRRQRHQGVRASARRRERAQDPVRGHGAAPLARLPMPTIAAIDGPALGGGLEIALACDLRVCRSGVTLGLPESRLGGLAGNGSVRLTRLVGPARAKELLFTGETITAEQALAWGLVNRVVDEGTRARRRARAGRDDRGARPAVEPARQEAGRRRAGRAARRRAVDVDRRAAADLRQQRSARGRGRVLREARAGVHGAMSDGRPVRSARGSHPAQRVVGARAAGAGRRCSSGTTSRRRAGISSTSGTTRSTFRSASRFPASGAAAVSSSPAHSPEWLTLYEADDLSRRDVGAVSRAAQCPDAGNDERARALPEHVPRGVPRRALDAARAPAAMCWRCV